MTDVAGHKNPDQAPFDWLNVHGQYMWHSPARIAGTKEALWRLRDLLVLLLDPQAIAKARGEFYASDGEGYTLTIEVLSEDEPEYIAEFAQSALIAGMAQMRQGAEHD